MKANITNLRQTERNVRRSASQELYREIAAIDPANGDTIVTARLYWPGAVTVYCTVWIHGAGLYGRGQGAADGYGYHKTSAALSAAISDAGISLSDDISGRGDSAMSEAVEAIARAVTGKRRIIIHTAHA